MTYELNGEELPPDTHLKIERHINAMPRAWLNGQPLKPNDRFSVNGVVIHVEPDPEHPLPKYDLLKDAADAKWEYNAKH